ncbi:MAG: hypothetical protein ACHQ4J_16935, partial [Candidatus Binatia bacterium]
MTFGGTRHMRKPSPEMFSTEGALMSSKRPSTSATKAIGAVAKPRQVPAAPPEAAAAEPARRSLDEIAEQLGEQESESSPARRTAQAKREQEVLETAATVTAESAVRAIGDLKVTIDSTLDQLSQQLVEQAKRLTAVHEAVAIKRQQLAELYDIEVVAETLAGLIRDYDQKKLQFAQDTEARKRDFEREMQEARAAWDKEKQRAQEELAAEKG